MRSEVDNALPPIVAILRGITPAQAVDVAQVIHQAGLRVLEIPLNSPQPFDSIRALATLQLSDSLIGAGTVLSVDDVRRTAEAGGRLVVAPNVDLRVIEAALEHGMHVMPGFATATEAFAAIGAGAFDLKLFPAITYGTGHLKALRAVLPKRVRVFPVGGIGADDIATWRDAGAGGFGFGSEVFRPNYSLTEIDQRARRLLASWKQCLADG